MRERAASALHMRCVFLMGLSADQIRDLMAIGIDGEKLAQVAEIFDRPLSRRHADKRDSDRERQRRHRERQAESRPAAIANDPNIVQIGADEFDQFWRAYPKRDGANPKAPAKKKFMALLRSGTSAEHIIGGARRYATDMRNRGQVGTPYVAQAMTWLNQRRFEDYRPAMNGHPIPAPAGAPTDEELRKRYDPSQSAGPQSQERKPEEWRDEAGEEPPGADYSGDV